MELEASDYSDIVTFRQRPDHETLELIGVSDIFCLPSLSEGISFATAEAMALGVTTVTSNIGGFPELIGKNGQTGLMFTPTGSQEGDVKEMLRRIEKLVRNAAWRRGMQKRAEKRVRGFFDASIAIQKLVRRILQTRLVRDTEKKSGNTLSLGRELEDYRKKAGPVVDFRHIQRGLANKKRVGYGVKYQHRCGEHGQAWTKIIDA